MKTTLLLLLATLTLSGCYYTRVGLTEDADRFGEKVQEIGAIISGP